MKKTLLLAIAPVALVAGCSSGNQADTAADESTDATTEMPANENMGTTGDSTMQPGGTGAAGTQGTTGTQGTAGTGDSTTDQMGRDTTTTPDAANSTGSGTGDTTGGTTPPQ